MEKVISFLLCVFNKKVFKVPINFNNIGVCLYQKNDLHSVFLSFYKMLNQKPTKKQGFQAFKWLFNIIRFAKHKNRTP